VSEFRADEVAPGRSNSTDGLEYDQRQAVSRPLGRSLSNLYATSVADKDGTLQIGARRLLAVSLPLVPLRRILRSRAKVIVLLKAVHKT
jgi:hypothetical protein